MMRTDRIVVLTGSGISAESGIATFRDPDGIWSKLDYRDVATPEAFQRNPKLVQKFYNVRRRGALTAKPNAAHLALVRLEQAVCADVVGSFALVTQNIDPLHDMAGSRNLIHMHGEILKALCNQCHTRHPWVDDITIETVCPNCGNLGGMRPDVVWFGELPYHMPRIAKLLDQAELFVSIGTSGAVYPAAGFVTEARRRGVYTVELNLEPSEGVTMFHEAIHGQATEIVPAFVDRILAAR